MNRTPTHHLVAVALAITAASAPAAAIDWQPRIQVGERVYAVVEDCDALVFEPRRRHVTIECHSPDDRTPIVFREDWAPVEGDAWSTGWTLRAGLHVEWLGYTTVEASGCELVGANDIRCNGFSDGFEP